MDKSDPRPHPPMKRTGAIVLAAGASTRLGQTKQLLQINGQSLIQRSIQSALTAGCEPVVVVLGAQSESIGDHLKHCGLTASIRMVFNRKWRDGMGRSIACGIQSLAADELDACFILLSDQPAVNARLLQNMSALCPESNPVIVYSDYGTSHGPPVLFSQHYFAMLSELRGDQGARAILRANQARCKRISFPEGLHDIDFPEDLHPLKNDSI